MAQKVHGGSAMLNMPGYHGLAAVVAVIDDTGPVSRTKSDWNAYKRPDAIVSISDCSRSIGLEIDGFYSDDPGAGHFENDLHKIDTLIETLSKFRRGLVLEQDRYLQRLERFGA